MTRDAATTQVVTARDKLAAAAGLLTHGLTDRLPMDEAIAGADRLLDVVAYHLQAARVALSQTEASTGPTRG